MKKLFLFLIFILCCEIVLGDSLQPLKQGDNLREFLDGKLVQSNRSIVVPSMLQFVNEKENHLVNVYLWKVNGDIVSGFKDEDNLSIESASDFSSIKWGYSFSVKPIVYPVCSNVSFNGFRDTNIFNKAQKYVNGLSEVFLLHESAGDNGRILLKVDDLFSNQTIPSDAAINSAVLYLFGSSKGANEKLIDVYMVNSDWVEGSFTGYFDNQTPSMPVGEVGSGWKSRKVFYGVNISNLSWQHEGGDYEALVNYTNVDGNGNAMVDVKSALQAWQRGVPNYGLIFIGGYNGKINLYSSDYRDVNLRPLLLVNFTHANGSSESMSFRDGVSPIVDSCTFSNFCDEESGIFCDEISSLKLLLFINSSGKNISKIMGNNFSLGSYMFSYDDLVSEGFSISENLFEGELFLTITKNWTTFDLVDSYVFIDPYLSEGNINNDVTPVSGSKQFISDTYDDSALVNSSVNESTFPNEGDNSWLWVLLAIVGVVMFWSDIKRWL